MAFDKHLLETMSPEEREAIEGVDDEADAAAAALAAEDDLDDDDGDDAKEPAAKPAEEPAAALAEEAKPAAVEPASAAAPAPAAETAAPSQPEPAAQAKSPLVFDLPADFQARVDAIKGAKTAAVERYRAGELSFEDYNLELEKINDSQRQLDSMHNTAHVSQLMRQQAEESRRTAAAQAVIDDGKKAGIDYQDEGKYAELRATMDALFNVKAHAEKGWDHVLREADRRMRAAYGVGAAVPKPAAQVKAEAAAARKPDLSGVPKTLADVPGGQGQGDVGGDFDDVLALDGEAFEDALESMARKNPERFRRFQAAMQ